MSRRLRAKHGGRVVAAASVALVWAACSTPSNPKATTDGAAQPTPSSATATSSAPAQPTAPVTTQPVTTQPVTTPASAAADPDAADPDARDPSTLLIQAGDLPAGWKSTPQSAQDEASDVTSEKALAACLSKPWVEPTQRLFGDFSSADGSEDAFSEVLVYPTAADVTADLADTTGSQWQACQETATKQALSNLTISTMVATPLHVPGTKYGLRVTVTVTEQGQQVPVTFDLMGFGIGNVESGTSFGFVGVPPDAALEAQVISAERARGGLS